MNDLKDIRREAEKALNAVRKAGADHARISLGTARSYSLRTKNDEIELIKESRSKGLGLTIYKNGRFGGFSSSDLRDRTVEDFAKKAVEMVDLTDPDPARGLPDKKFTGPLPKDDLQLFDPAIASSLRDKSKDLCRAMTDAARKTSSEIGHIEAAFSESHGASVLLTSDGFVGEREGTSVGLNIETYVAEGDGRKHTGYDSRSWRFAADMDPAEALGRTAAERTLAQKGSAPGKTGEYPIIFINYWGDYITGLLLQAISGASVYRKMTCLGDKRDKLITSDKLTLIDDPFIRRGLGSQTFDGEGMVAQRRPIIEKGVLKNFYFDTYWARKQGVEPTTGGGSNFTFSLGTRSGEQMFEAADRAVFITDMIGGNFNAVSGDFSAGIRGFLKEGGKKIPITEMNLAGNLLTVLPKLEELGNDPYRYMSIRSPAMRFAPMMVTGV